MLKLAIITLLLIGTVAAVSISGYKGSSKKFSLRPVAKDSDKTPNRSRTARSSGAADRFPEELQYVMNLEDLGEVELDLIRDRSVRVPRSFSRGKSGQYETHGLDTDNLAFYKETNGHGSFACQLKQTDDGESECLITALLDMGEENCYLSPGTDTLDCSSQDVGGQILSEAKVDPALRHENGTASRQKRAVQLPPAAGFRSIEVAYLPDAKFTDLFYRRHPGDIAAAEAEMDLFFTLLTNDMNVYFSTVGEATSFQLQLQVYAAAVAYPGFQMNFPWSENYNDGTYLNYNRNVEANIEFIINDSGFITEQYDFVFAITGFDLRDVVNGNNVVSRSHQSVLCTDSRQKYAVSEFTAYNLPRILVHELGHSLGALDDDVTTCPANVNIMSQNMFNPNSTTKDTYFKFSTCSGAAMVSQVFTTIPDCLVDDAFSYDNDYVPQFCTGYAGTQADYLNKQCERLTNIIGSTACDTVDEEACYRRNQVRCTDGNGQCTNRKLQYVWNGTPCDTNKFCYQGSCVDKFSVCVTTTTTTSTTTTTPTPTTTTTTTTPTPTTTTDTRLSCSCCRYRYYWHRRYCCLYAHYHRLNCYCCGTNGTP